MSRHPLRAAAACVAVLVAVPLSAAAAQQSTFTGAWAPTAANGFALASPGVGWSAGLSVSADGSTLTAVLDNGSDLSFASFFLENYGFLQSPAVLLPVGQVRYDYSITYTTAGDSGVSTFDDFGHAAWVPSGGVITGSHSVDYTGGYFGYFGINLRGFDSNLGDVPASATVVLTNFSAPAAAVPEPAAWLLTLAGVGVFAAQRRRV